MTTATIDATAKTCTHPGCSCEVAGDYPFCSPECAATVKVATEAVTCPCAHPACKAIQL